MINGSYWIGSAAGAAAALFFLDTSIFAADFGWRLAFGVGAVLGLTILLVRRNVPESPRWLFIHGREDEAERIVDEIEERTAEEAGHDLEDPEQTITIRQRERIPFREIARTAFKLYPRRSLLGLALFVGQAFLYNGVVFNLGGLFTKYFGVSSGTVPVFVILYALGNFLGPLLLGRLFDTVGRKPMIILTYLGSSAVALAMAILFLHDSLTRWSLEGLIIVTFFLASAGASAAYLTVSEVFPMETRALAIAFFYAVGTAVGGISGPLVFSHLIASGSRAQVATAFFIGLSLMVLGGLAELFFGVKAEQESLEDVAQPLTADDAGGSLDDRDGRPDEDTSPESEATLRCRRAALETRARAAEHRANVHELRANASPRSHDRQHEIEAESALAEAAELQARAMDERAVGHEELHAATRAKSGQEREAARERAAAADDRALALERESDALFAEREDDADRNSSLAAALRERSRAHEQRALARQALHNEDAGEGAAREAAEARARVHEAWASMHEEREQENELRAEGDAPRAALHHARANERREQARAAEELAYAAEQRQAADELEMNDKGSEHHRVRSEDAARRRAMRARENQVRRQIDRRRHNQRTGLRRFRPGPGTGSAFFSPGMVGTSGATRPEPPERIERDVDTIARALQEHGTVDRGELARIVGARYWGPGRFRQALRAAIDDGRVQRRARGAYGPRGQRDNS